MPVAPTRALSPPTRPTPNHQGSKGAGSRLGKGGTGRLGQGFGPRLLPGPGPRRTQAGGGSGRSVAGVPGRVLVVSQTGQQQEQQTAVVRPGVGDVPEANSSAGSTSDIPGDQALPPPPAPAGVQAAQADDPAGNGGSGGSVDAMHGQPPYRQQGLPSSRSDTMLLQSAEQGRFGMLSGSAGGVLGLGRSASSSGSDRRAAGGPATGAAPAAAGAGQQAPRGQAGAANSIPVFVMLPLDTVNADGVFRYAQSKWFSAALQRLAATGIRGVAVDVWWGAVERRPRRYDWSGYRQLFALVRALGLRLQVVMSFHACGGNVGDNAQIPLPQWVLQAGESDPDIFFTDRPRELFPGQRNRECLSFFADEEPGLLRGRSPMQCYVDFMRAFRDEFLLDLGGLIEEVVVGCGPCGELRYPSYPEANGWRFPGVGEFQCYDRRALASLAAAAREAGHPEWGNTGPHDTGSYNSSPEETGFFCSWGGNWETDYGRFFLEWYSGALLDHGERMLTAATSVFNTRRQGQRGWGPNVINGGRSRSLPDLPGSSAGSNSRPAHKGLLPPLPAGAEDAAATAAGAAGVQQQQQQQQQQRQGEAATDKALLYSGDAFDAGLVDSYRLQQQQQQAQQQQQQLAQQQQQQRRQQQKAAALRTSPSVDMLPAAGQAAVLPPSGAPSPLPPPLPSLGASSGGAEPGSAVLAGGGLPPAGVGAGMGMGMRHHASYSSLRSSVSESEEWMGEGGAGCCPAGPAVDLTLKVAGVHWWYRTRSHAAELTAGYFNTDERDGYGAILQLCARHGVGLTLTCVEMCDAQHPPEALCGPEGLLRQVRERAASIGVSVAGENALPCFMPNIIDETALHRIVYNTQPWGTPLQTGAGSSGLDPAGQVAVAAAAAASPPDGGAAGQPAAGPAGLAGAANGSSGSPQGAGAVGSPGSSGVGSPSSSGGDSPGGSTGLLHSAKLPPMRAFTFLRLTDMMMTSDYQRSWAKFMRMMSVNAQRFRTSATWRRGMGFE